MDILRKNSINRYKNIYLNVKTFTIPIFYIIYCCIDDYIWIHLNYHRC